MLQLLKNLSILYYWLFPKLFGIGYNENKIRQIKKKIKKIPIKQNHYLDERIIEIPWIINELNSHYEKKILDAGCTLNYKYLIDEILKNKNKITFVNLYPEKFVDKRNSVSYISSDIAKLNIKDEDYNVVSCISVLEHLGFNNEIYDTSGNKNPNFTANKSLYLSGIKEIKRVLKKNGTLYLTIPYGKRATFDNIQQFDDKDIDKIIDIFQPGSCSILYYKYFDKEKRWNKVTSEACKDVLHIIQDNKNTFISANTIALITLHKFKN